MKTLSHCVCSVWLLLVLAAPLEAAGHRVLLLQGLDRGNLTLDYFTGNLRVDMDARAGDSITFTQVVVSPSGFDVNPDEAVVNYIEAAFEHQPTPDLIIAMAGPAAAFARRNRHRLFPGTPLLLAGVDERFLAGAPLARDEAAVMVANDFAGNVHDILQLFPETTTVFMVIGSGEHGRFWRRALEPDLQRFRDRVAFIWTDGMPYGQVLRQASQLPAHSAILHLGFGTDGRDGAYSEGRVLADIRGVANAPLFGTQDTQLGHGIVGGRLMSIDELSRTAADVALRILDGESPAGLEPTVQRPGDPIFDWRQLRRWGVSDSRLPPNSVIRFQQPGVWERFKWIISAAILALLAQALLITGLLVNRAKRHRAEQSVRESENRFRVLANSAPVMIRLSGPDMRCTDVNHPWLTFTGRTLAMELGRGWLDGLHTDDLARCVQDFPDAAARREPFRVEYRLRRFDGEYRWVLESWQPRVTPDGSFEGFVSSVIDVTDLRTAQATLSNLNRRLMEAQEQERTRLARELHDDVSQRMTLLSIELDRLRQALPANAAGARELASTLNDTVASVSKDIQAISHRLHSSKLDYLGLAAAAGSYCREVSTQKGVAIEYVHDVPAQLPGDVAINVFRVLQEAIGNAVKHSGASRFRVALRARNDHLRLEVVDDGCGFDVEAALAGRGLGLISMQERLRLIDGDVTIESEPGGGTRICASVPLRPVATEAAAAAGSGG